MSENSIIKSFDYKWYQFLIIYGIINLYFLYCCLNPGIDEILPLLFGGDMHDDTGGLTTAIKLFMLPLQAGVSIALIVFAIAILEILGAVSILIFRLVYFRSEVKDEEKSLLSHYIIIALGGFLLAYLLGIIFLGEIRYIVYYVLIYLPIPFLTFVFVYLKVKNDKEQSNKKRNWANVFILPAIVIVT